MWKQSVLWLWGGVLLWCILGCGSCQGSRGEMKVKMVKGLSFVGESEVLYVLGDHESPGLYRVSLDGKEQTQLLSTSYRVDAITPDGRLWVLGDSDTNLFLFEPEMSNSPVRIPELDGRASGVAISPDGKTVAVSKHDDYHLPQGSEEASADDAIYLVDVATKKVKVVPPFQKGWATRLVWLEPNKIVMRFRAFNKGFSDRWMELDLEQGTRVNVEKDSEQMYQRRWRLQPRQCEGRELRSDDTGIYSVEADSKGKVPQQEREYHVPLEGKRRGFHDHMSAFPLFYYTPTCEHLVFQFGQMIYVQKLASGETGPLMRGSESWMLAKD